MTQTSVVKARLARFYGWSPREIDSLYLDELYQYFQAIEPLTASEKIDLLAVADFPHMKEKPRKDLIGGLRKAVSKLVGSEKRTSITNEELAKILSGR